MPEGDPAAQARPGSVARVLRGLAISLVSLAALAVLFEVACHLVDLPGLTRDELDPVAAEMRNARVAPHPYLGYANKPGYVHEPTAKDPATVRHNSLGMHGPETTWEKPADTYRIVCLGGSSTYGIGPSSWETNWPNRLQIHLNETKPAKQVEVLNLGCQGYSTFEMQIALELRGVDLRPDLVLCYETINDMRCALYPGVVRDNAHWRAVWPVVRKDAVDRALESSYVYLAWRRYLTDWWSEQGDLGTWAIVDFGKYEPDNYAQPSDPDLGFASFRRNLVSIVGVARSHGSEVMLVTQGVRLGDFDRFGSRELQRAGFTRMTSILGDIANERGVPYCDAGSVLAAEADRQRAATGTDRVFVHPGENGQPGRGEVHMTDEGCDLLARTIAARIEGLRLID